MSFNLSFKKCKMTAKLYSEVFEMKMNEFTVYISILCNFCLNIYFTMFTVDCLSSRVHHCICHLNLWKKNHMIIQPICGKIFLYLSVSSVIHTVYIRQVPL